MGFSKGEDSGKFRLKADEVCYESRTYETWRAAIADIRVIGEYTNQNGPYADDYFVCFVTTDDGGWLEGSYHAADRDALFAGLGERLGCRLDLKLQASADFASRIVWPAHLAGEAMFEFGEQTPKGFWQHLKHRLGTRDVVQTLSAAVVGEMRRHR